jgi:hypothetical protein
MFFKLNNCFFKLFVFLFILNINIFAKTLIINTLFVDMYVKNPNIWLKENKELSLPDEVYAIFGSGDSQYILRSTQALKYDLVQSIEENDYKNDQFIRIRHPYYYYFNLQENILDNRFWIDKDFLSDINIALQNINGTIINPIYDENDKILFLPGTMAKGEFVDNKVLLNDLFYIEKEDFIFDYQINKENEMELRDRFLNILNNWISFDDNKTIIPYVWGGTTLLKYTTHDCLKILMKNKIEGFSWKESVIPCIGVDCSGLVCLAARIAGFDFYLRNSFAQMKYLKKLDLKKDEIKKGDILWIPGHVIILDPENDCCIESASYSSGYCGVVKNKLRDRFENIEFFDDFVDLKISNEPLKIKSKNGKISEYNNFEILDIYSCFCIEYEN